MAAVYMYMCMLQSPTADHLVIYLLSVCLQPESQKKISHAEITSDYPRYPNVFKVIRTLTPADRQMLMVQNIQ